MVKFHGLVGVVLSGPQVTSQQPTESQGVTIEVSNIQTGIQVLWELDQPPTTTTTLPSFPLRKINNSYELRLLWKTEERLADNKNAAESAVRSLIKRLQSSGEFENYEKILMGEYLELGAIELEPCPQEPGFYMPHHAVIRKEAITTKRRIVFNASAKGTWSAANR